MKQQENTESKVERLGQFFKRNVRKLREKSHNLDLVFLVDESSSVGSANFISELKFVKKLLSDFPVVPSATRVAIVTFSSKNNVVPRVDYISSPQLHQHKCSLLNQEIPAINYKGGGTYTKGAFQQAAAVVMQAVVMLAVAMLAVKTLAVVMLAVATLAAVQSTPAVVTLGTPAMATQAAMLGTPAVVLAAEWVLGTDVNVRLAFACSP
ncbi:UNVERIFIED_CONTAM: hypothetical protein FKN15_073949 [Acipenser sinensis]